ncbi:bromodomain containing 7/9 isoform X4 [Oratosquilla oratoria]|uniref:bromodomain containing 7/9 isoform X4 n=1 Tax=Oratosquilla oratoria TaxID=337810 RepID=UPI003F75B9BD
MLRVKLCVCVLCLAFSMEKTPLKLKLRLASGGSSTPEHTGSPSHPTIVSSMAEEPAQPVVPSDEEGEEEEEWQEEGQLIVSITSPLHNTCHRTNCSSSPLIVSITSPLHNTCHRTNCSSSPCEEEVGAEEEGKGKSRHSHHEDGTSREKHKKSKKKKKKKEKEKDRHKHRHHKDKAEKRDEGEGDESVDGLEPPMKKVHLDTSQSSPAPDSVVVGSKGTQGALQQLLDHLIRLLEKKDPQQMFAWPVTDSIAPGYSSIISQPMDFSTMRQKIDDNKYTSLSQFEADFRLMCNNCMTYNQTDTIFYKTAKKLLHIGEKMMVPEKLHALKKELPIMAQLSKDQVGVELNPDICGGKELETTEQDTVENMDVQNVKKEPENKFEGVQDDMSPEDILAQAQKSAREAADKLTVKKPASALGFLRQRVDGTTSLNFVTGCEGNNPDAKEKPISLGLLTGKITQGTASLHNYREDKRNMAKPVKPLYYGAFSSFCPSYDSTFANMTKEESEMVYSTYGNETAVQYAESICDFSRDCDVAMHLVDQLLNLITHQQHSRTKAVINERRKLQEEEERINALLCPPKEVISQPSATEPKEHHVDYNVLHSLKDIGIDTGFLSVFENAEKQEKIVKAQLSENAQLLEKLSKEQQERLSRPPPTNLNSLPQPSSQELQLVEQVTEGLTVVAKAAPPGALAPVPMVDVEGSSSKEECAVIKRGRPSLGGDGDIERQLQQILHQTEASSPPPRPQSSSNMTDTKLKEILGR